VSFFTGQFDTLSELSPSEQAVYVRLSVMSENGKVRGRYADVAKLANVSLSTFKRVVKSLSVRGLVEVVWRQKTPSPTAGAYEPRSSQPGALHRSCIAVFLSRETRRLF